MITPIQQQHDAKDRHDVEPDKSFLNFSQSDEIKLSTMEPFRSRGIVVNRNLS